MKTLLLVALLTLSGCVSLSGVVMTDAEAKACQADGCTVWTDAEIQALIRRVHKSGYTAGVNSI